MEKVNKKVERYIQLSKHFEKSSEEIFGKETLSNVITFSEGFLGCGRTISYSEASKEKSRAEKIREQSEIKAKIAEDYDEYLQLQKELGDYFTSLNKLTQ